MLGVPLQDLEFRSDISLLAGQYGEMGERAMVGIAPDLTPHYRGVLLQRYTLTHPNTVLIYS